MNLDGFETAKNGLFMTGLTDPNRRAHRAENGQLRPHSRRAALGRTALLTGVFLAVLPVTFTPDNTPSALSVPQALAQQTDTTTEALFLAVDGNDLAGVQAAVDAGANIEARDYNGMQPVDLAIERGYFDIAHYLISMRNNAAGGTETSQTPAQTPAPDGQVPEDTAQEPASDSPLDFASDQSPLPAQPDGAPSPFDRAQTDGDLPVIGDIREAAPKPDDAIEQAQIGTEAAPELRADEPVQVAQAVEKKPSASKTFITTFMDFFKPPNTTGIVRGERRDTGAGGETVTDEDIARQLEEMDPTPIKGPAVPITPEELASQLPETPDLQIDDTGDIAPLDTGTLPPYSVQPARTDTPEPQTQQPPAAQTPTVASEDAFGDLQVEDAKPAESASAPPAPAPAPSRPSAPPPKAAAATNEVAALDTFLDEDLPFNGGVDPDILALLGLKQAIGESAELTGTQTPTQATPQDPFAAKTPPASQDPFAAAAPSGSQDPFAEPQKDEASVSGILKSIDEPQEVTELRTHRPPSPAGDQDPFAQSAPADPFAQSAPADPFAAPAGDGAGALDGLLESTDNKADGWDVKDVEGGPLPDQMAALASIEPTGHILDGTELALGLETVIGQPVGEDRMALLTIESIHKPCIQRGGPETIFCVDTISWPFELEEDFLVDTIMYQGTRAIGRYDAGGATRFHALFRTEAMARVIKYYTERYGPPSEKIDRAIAPLAQPRRDNPTYIWRSREPGTDTINILEIRQFDDARGGGFPDTKRGVILLYREHAGTIFPELSQLELMVLKDDGALDLQPKAPETVW